MGSLKTSSLEVLMSVMYQENFDIAYRSKVDSDLLIINQCDKEDYQEIEVNGHLWRMISTTERGLSKSRNMALRNARGDICILADDDECFSDDYATYVMNEYSQHPTVSSFVFNLHREGKTKKKRYYCIKEKRKSPFYRNYGSPSITFRIKDVLRCKITFDEVFGSGSIWGAGEDNLFIKSIRENKLAIFENPYYLATIFYSDSLWFDGYNDKYYYNEGAFWYYYYKNNLVMRVIMYANCCRSNGPELSRSEKWRWLHIGKKGFINNKPYEEYMNENPPID